MTAPWNIINVKKKDTTISAHHLRVSSLNDAYSENGRQLMASAFSHSLTFEDPGRVHRYKHGDVHMSARRSASRFVNEIQRHAPDADMANRGGQNVGHTPGFFDGRPIGGRQTLWVLHNFADALHVLAAWCAV